jgi:hypothetical protein
MYFKCNHSNYNLVKVKESTLNRNGLGKNAVCKEGNI